MKTKHLFVAALDVGGLVPFVVKPAEKLEDNLKEQDRARAELVKFIDALEAQYATPIYYMGMDIIEGKNYERFLFGTNGFFEIMNESPLAMNAHFTDEDAAKKFCAALKATLTKMLPDNPVSKMFIDSIEVQSEQDQSLTYDKWDTMKRIK